MIVPVSRLRALILVAFVSFGVASCGINNVPTLQEAAKAKWAEVENQYQRRADLIPSLVETVKGYAKQEKDVLTAVTEARAKATSIHVDANDLTDPAKVKQLQDAQNALSGALGRLLAVSENYPDLKSNQNFLALQSQLEGTENRIAVARKDYIAAVQAYNTELRTFPGVIWASTVYHSAQPMAEFTANECGANGAGRQVLTALRALRLALGAFVAALCLWTVAAAFGAVDLPAAERAGGRRARTCCPADTQAALTTKLASLEAKVRHPARRRDRPELAGRGDRALRQRTVPRLEARRGEEEQRRAAARRAERA